MKLTIKDTLIQSSRLVFYNAKFVVLLWITNSAFALLTSVVIYTLLENSLSHSIISDQLNKQFDYFWYVQFQNLNKIQFEQIPLLIYIVVVIYTLIQTFYLGGLISVFNNYEKNHMVDFFYGGVKYFFRFFKVVLVSTLLYGLGFILNDNLGNMISYFFRNSENVLAEFVIRSLRYSFLIFLIGIISIVSDYTKVALAIDDKHNILNYISKSARFIYDNFRVIFSTFFIIALIGAGGAILYNAIVYFLPRTPYYFLAIAFILQQILVIFRLLIRMYFYSSEVMLYKDLSAEIINKQ
ncbi:MAG: hypothetical protein ACOYVE_09090 [Melioribacter sp.]|uniref:hypothetical protein n=1 Tax=Melioribacter sp. TaxID=2052167 RepID=UPI003BCA3739